MFLDVPTVLFTAPIGVICFGVENVADTEGKLRAIFGIN